MPQNQLISGAYTAKMIRLVFLQASHKFLVTRPKPLPALTFTALLQAQQMGAHEAAEYRLQGGLNMQAPLPVLFLALPGTDIRVNDEIAYASHTYKVLTAYPQDSPDGVTQFIEIKTTVK